MELVVFFQWWRSKFHQGATIVALQKKYIYNSNWVLHFKILFFERMGSVTVVESCGWFRWVFKVVYVCVCVFLFGFMCVWCVWVCGCVCVCVYLAMYVRFSITKRKNFFLIWDWFPLRHNDSAILDIEPEVENRVNHLHIKGSKNLYAFVRHLF